MCASNISRHGMKQQNGAVMMVMIVILVLGITTALVGSLSASALNTARQKITVSALAQAKEALLGRAVSDDNMPGSLPCPDTDNDGSAELLSGNNCPSYIGRLPWRTLRLPEIRDGSGELLWYALSLSFRDDVSTQPLNSNTKGTLEVYQADGLTPQTQEAVAIIFSPGNPLASQNRGTVAEQNSAANYLDIANGRNNATAASPFIAGTKSDTFNDQLLHITTRDLMPLLEKRVAGVVKQALTDYFTTNGYYPWADQMGGGDYDADAGENRGWLPKDAADGGAANWDDFGNTPPPPWYFANEWYKLIYYSVAKDYARPSCSSCVDNTLSVGSNNGVRALFFMPGTAILANISPAVLRVSNSDLSHYLEDAENKDNANDLYVTPASQATDRDRLYWLSSALIWTP